MKYIMLVENDPIVALAQTLQLENLGYGVIAVYNEKQALTILDQEMHVDMILMDIDLGNGLDGLEVAKSILSKYSLPLVFLSSYTDKEVVKQAEMISSYGYIVKNSDRLTLNTSINIAFTLFKEKKNSEACAVRY